LKAFVSRKQCALVVETDLGHQCVSQTCPVAVRAKSCAQSSSTLPISIAGREHGKRDNQGFSFGRQFGNDYKRQYDCPLSQEFVQKFNVIAVIAGQESYNAAGIGADQRRT
jgi:hypothetical protein